MSTKQPNAQTVTLLQFPPVLSQEQGFSGFSPPSALAAAAMDMAAAAMGNAIGAAITANATRSATTLRIAA
ncbi:MAG: hypothetical protein ACT4N4_14435, partial [Rhodospirillales bacterium]